MKRLAVTIAAVTASMAVLAIAAAGFGHSPRELFAIMIGGSVGSSFALEGTVLKSVPLLLTGLAVVLAFRAGVWNIGGEGQFIVGALAAFATARYGSAAALCAAALAGSAWASIASVMRIWRNAPEVLTTILLNFIAIHLLGWAVNGPLQEPSGQYPQTEAVPDAAALAQLGHTGLHSGVLIALLLAVAAWWLVYRTHEGLRLRATGFNPSASRWAGIDTNWQMARAMLFSGAVAGVGGGVELLGVTHRLFERFASGYGYSGIAVALLAQLHPLGTLAASLFFGALSTGAGELQRSANISATVATFGQAVVILTLLLFSGHTQPASAHGSRSMTARLSSLLRGHRAGDRHA